MNVSISEGNAKMGAIKSVSLPAGLTCRSDCACRKMYYAARLERRRKTVREAYKRNFDVLTCDPDAYFREVEAAVMTSRFFRFHVSGDIPDADYFEYMVKIAQRNPHCEILCFTKRYEIVNTYLDKHHVLPENLHMVFSVWRGFPCRNPHRLPEAHIRYRDGSTTAGENAKECGGNCTECAIGTDDSGCWNLKNGEQVVFHEH